MQPEPAIYLRGVRRELLRRRRVGGQPDDPAFVASMERGAETLLQLALRLELLPEVLSSFLADQLSLLSESLALARTVGVDSVAAAEAASCLVDEALAGEPAIARFDRLLDAQSELLAALSRHTGREHETGVAKIASRAIAFEQRVRDAVEAKLTEMRDQQVRVMEGFGEPDPTPEDVTAYIQAHVPSEPDLRAVQVRRQRGVNTKEIFFIQLEGGKSWPPEAVLRRNRRVDSVGNVVADEFELLEFLHGAGLTVPRPLAADHATDLLRRPFLLTGRLPGRTESVETLGEARVAVFADMARFLAKLHSLPLTRLKGRPVYGVGVKARTRAMLDRFYKSWKTDLYQPSLTLEAAFVWLRANVDHLSDGRAVIHGDFNLRNILIDEGRISGVLDWELAHEGHPAEDLGYCRPQVEQAMKWSDFVAIYAAAGGPVPNDFDVRYFQIYGLTFGISSIVPACNGYLKSRHDDLLIGSCGFIEFPTLVPTLEALIQAEYANAGVTRNSGASPDY